MQVLDPMFEELLGEGFPDKVYVIYHPPTRRYGCYCHQKIHGLACFSSKSRAVEFEESIEIDGTSVLEMTFDEAREVAKTRPMPVTTLMLLDNINDPKIHYVR